MFSVRTSFVPSLLLLHHTYCISNCYFSERLKFYPLSFIDPIEPLLVQGFMGSILEVTFDPVNPPPDCPPGMTYGFLPVRGDADLAIEYPFCWEQVMYTQYNNSIYVPPTGATVRPRDFFGIDGGFLGKFILSYLLAE